MKKSRNSRGIPTNKIFKIVFETILNLIKIRLKFKTFVNLYHQNQNLYVLVLINFFFTDDCFFSSTKNIK